MVTARPSYARVKTVLQAIEAHPDLRLQLVITGSALLDKYGKVVDIIEADGFEIIRRVFTLVEGETLLTSAKTTGMAIIELSTVLNDLNPDVVVTIADRYETIATAIAASYMHIPLAHIQGGEITGSIDEKVRHSITKLSDLHLTATDLARRRVIAMGEEPAQVYWTGCPSVDLAAEVVADGLLDFDPYARYGGVGQRPDLKDGYVLVMHHPVTHEHMAARAHTRMLLELMAELGIPVLWFWPNVDAGSDESSKAIRMFREQRQDSRMHFFKNMNPTDFLKLMLNSRGIVGNSSVAIREGSFMGVPAVNIGSRQRHRERGLNVIDTTYDRDEITDAVTAQIAKGRIESDPIYGDGRAGKKIASVLASAELFTDKSLLL